MRKIIVIFCALFAAILSNDGYCNASMRSENIRVLLEKDIKDALLEVRGPYFIYNPADGAKISSGSFGKRFKIRASSTGIRWGEEFPGIHQVLITPRSSETSILLNGIEYSGGLAFYKLGNTISVINIVDVETFVKSILIAEFPNPLETEVMSALAISARTTAYYHMNRAKAESFWDVEAQDVGYVGCSMITKDSPIVTAVNSTKNMILVNSQDGKNSAFAAYWTKHSAGKTAALHSIFRNDMQAPKEGVEVPQSSLDRDNVKWSFAISKDDLAEILKVKKIEKIEFFVDKNSGKTYGFRVKGGKEVHDFDFFQFQEKVGKDKLLSNDLKLKIKGETITFSGYGEGHGVGVCLHAASSMAQRGDMAVKILSQFFPGTSLVSLEMMKESKKIAK